MRRPRAYPILMSRLRLRAGLLLLSLMLVGIAGDAGSTLAAGACCAGMPADHAASEREAPCRSLAPTSCCEANAAGHAPGPPAAPTVATAVATPAPAVDALPGAGFGPVPAAPARITVATIFRL